MPSPRWPRDRSLRLAILAALALTLTGVVPLASPPSAAASSAPTMTNPLIQRVPTGNLWDLYGRDTGSSVTLHIHRAGTPADDYSVLRTVSSGGGFWSFSGTMGADFRAYVTSDNGTVRSPTALVTSQGAPFPAPTVSNPAVTRQGVGTPFTVAGYATANRPVDLYYHRQGTAPDDYSIHRTVMADGVGRWSRTSILDVDYRVYAQVGPTNPRSATVLFTTHLLVGPSIDGVSGTAGGPEYLGLPYSIYGRAPSHATVDLHFRRVARPSDPEVTRSVVADADGYWHRTSVLDAGYSVVATVGVGNPHSATLYLTARDPGPKLDDLGLHLLPRGSAFTVSGWAAPLSTVTLHYRNATDLSVDVVRTVVADGQGSWSRTAVLDRDYVVHGVVGVGTRPSYVAGFTGAYPVVGGSRDIEDFSHGPALGVTVRSVTDHAAVAPGAPSAGAGHHYAAASVCLSGRGPTPYAGLAPSAFTLSTEYTGYHYGENLSPVPVTAADGPTLDLTTPIAVGEQRCGSLMFEVADALVTPDGTAPSRLVVLTVFPTGRPFTEFVNYAAFTIPAPVPAAH